MFFFSGFQSQPQAENQRTAEFHSQFLTPEVVAQSKVKIWSLFVNMLQLHQRKSQF